MAIIGGGGGCGKNIIDVLRLFHIPNFISLTENNHFRYKN